MRGALIILLLLPMAVAFGQSDTAELKDAVTRLNKAMIAKDTATLEKLLHKDVTFGHSSGWVQTKKELENDLLSGKLVYNTIENTSTTIVASHKDWASVRSTTNATGSANQTAFRFTLHVLQVWIKTKEGWKLVARQSAKLN